MLDLSVRGGNGGHEVRGARESERPTDGFQWERRGPGRQTRCGRFCARRWPRPERPERVWQLAREAQALEADGGAEDRGKHWSSVLAARLAIAVREVLEPATDPKEHGGASICLCVRPAVQGAFVNAAKPLSCKKE